MPRDYDPKLPADRFTKSAIKFFPTSPEGLESRYEQRNYTPKQLVDKNFKQRQKSIASDTTALTTLGIGTMTQAERRGYKRQATSNMLSNQGVPERKLTWTERFASVGDGLNIFSSKKK